MCEKAIEEFFKNTYDGMLVNGNTFSILWDLLQIEFECCGFNKIENIGQNASSGLSLPKSCCKKVDAKSELVSLDGLLNSSEELLQSCESNPSSENSNIHQVFEFKISGYL